MKKLVMFFMGLLLMCLMFGMVVVGAAIYDTASQQTIDTFFFQPSNLSSQRIDAPESFDNLSNDDIRKMLVEKFITEYFYVIPDMNNVDARLKGTMGLSRMVSADVFRNWVATTGNEISQMASNKSLRFARLIDMQLPHDSENWWTITYELTTWTTPNDLAHAPSVTRGIMYINLNYEPGFRPTMYGEEFDMGDFLENGGDPSLMFKFRVENIE
ncbi:MAG: hypothetical protein IJ500_03010 [Alphaproteobacteria bacterium]|nr:hypothetical protein [Alphaproteobacteria bacterium]